MQSASTVHYPDKIRLRVPRGLPDALRLAARQRHTTPAEWARQALLRGLEAQGVQLREEQPVGGLVRPDNRRMAKAKGSPKTGGRRKGTPNKVTADLQDAAR